MCVQCVCYLNPAAGKTSLIQRFAFDSFDSVMPATIGVDFRIKTITQDGYKCVIILEFVLLPAYPSCLAELRYDVPH